MPSIEEFLSEYSHRIVKSSYRGGIKRVLSFIYKTPIPNDELEDYAARYLREKHDIAAELIAFQSSPGAPKSIRSYTSHFRQWLAFNNIGMPESASRKMRRKQPRPRARTKDIPINKDFIGKMLQFADVRMKVIILLQASSGMRIGEIASVNVGDASLKDRSIYIRDAKNGEPRTVFFSNEALDALNAWFSVRDSYYASSLNRNIGLANIGKEMAEKKADDPRIFPFDPSVLRDAFRRILRKMGVYEKDSETGRGVVSTHSLRKFFSTSLHSSGMPPDCVEQCMGHEGYLGASYRRRDLVELKAIYDKYVHAVTLSVPAEQYEHDVRETKNDVDALIRGKSVLEAQNITLSTQVDELSSALKSLVAKLESKGLLENVGIFTGYIGQDKLDETMQLQRQESERKKEYKRMVWISR